MVDAAHLTSPVREQTDAVQVAPMVRPARIALAHDWLVARRGGELVLDALAALIERDHTISALYTLCANGEPISENIDRLSVVHSPIQRLGGAGPLRRWMLPLFPSAVASLSRRLARDHEIEPIDLLISSSSCAIKGLRPPPGVPHLCYCHAPARYVWNHRRESSQGSLLRSLALRAYGPRFRAWDRSSSCNVTRFLANSDHTANMIKSAYARDSITVHPPVRTDLFTPDPSTNREDFWLVVSALEPYKRADLAIEAARRSRERLVIVGTGSVERQLRASAPSNVVFKGRLDDDQVREMYRTARGLLFPQVEDFGIVAVEAQACGCPVVARRAGGALDTVIDATTGAFFDDPDPEQLLRAMSDAPKDCDDECAANAQRFSIAQFESRMKREIDAALAHAAEASPDALAS